MGITLSGRKKESWKIFDEIAGTYDFLNRLLSFGIDKYWRTKFLKNLPSRDNLNALDLATGTGDTALVLARHPKVTKVTGLDLSMGMIELGKKKVARSKFANKVQLVHGDGVQIPCADNSVDAVTISFGIRNFSDAQKSMFDIFRVLRPGGRVLIMEFSIPRNRFFRAIYFFYFRHLLPFVGNLVSKHKDAYTYLNETVEDFPYGDEFAGMLTKAGFENVHYKELTFGIATLYIGDKVNV